MKQIFFFTNLRCSCRINQINISSVWPFSLTNVPLAAVTGMKLSPLLNIMRSMFDSTIKDRTKKIIISCLFPLWKLRRIINPLRIFFFQIPGKDLSEKNMVVHVQLSDTMLIVRASEVEIKFITENASNELNRTHPFSACWCS